MQCPRCQHENPQHAKFCLECGARLALTCAKCRAELPGSAKFCLECGEPVAQQIQTRSPESYTPRHLAERILTSRGALEGERKQVTVLFADLKGSMELLADRDPEEARKILDPVLERMMEAVHRYEGTVNQVMGDGIMALFGAPIAHEDHGVRACYAALRMQESVKNYAETLRREEGVTIRIRVGLNSGDVVVRAIGSDLHMDYTAVGQTTHLAARMEQLADPGAVLMAPATLALAEDFIQVRSLGPTPVKGVSEPVHVYELLGATPTRSRFHAQAARGLTKFVGRTSEIGQLAEALDLARNGRGQVVAVIGEAGVGKSRLFWEFAHSHRADGCLVIEAASVSYGKAGTYLPVIELLRGYFQIEPRDEPRKIREKVTGKLLSLDRALQPTLPALLALLDVPVEDEPWAHLEPAQRRQRTLDAVKGLLLRESQVQPLVVIFEDLHWIDGETQAVLEGVVEGLPTARLLLLVNYRPEYRHSWGGKTYYRQLRIDALSAASAQDLLDGLLGSDPSLVPLKRLLIERTEGNPFFLEESVRTLVETKVLEGASGAYRVTKAPAGLQVPATAQAVVAGRIDRLEPEDKRLLQAASVIGKDVPIPLLEGITDLSDEALRPALGRLQASEFLYETKLFPEVEYTFKHALTHEVTYGGLLQERRRALHARLVNVIEQRDSGRVPEHVEQLAHHSFRAGTWDKALTYLRQAGAKARSRSAYAEAVTYLERALEALGHLPGSASTLERGIDLQLELRASLHPLTQNERMMRCLEEAVGLAETLGDPRRLVRVCAAMALQLPIVGDPVRSLHFAERAAAWAHELNEPRLRGSANYTLAYAHHFLGNYRTSSEILKEIFERFSDLSSSVDPSWSFANLGGYSGAWLSWSMSELGEFDSAIRVGEEACRRAEELRHSVIRIGAWWALACPALVRGVLPDAVSWLERGLGEALEMNINVWTPGYLGALGRAYALSGRIGEAVPLLEQAVDLAATGNRSSEGLLLSWLSEGLLLAGRPEQASVHAHRAVQLCRDRRARGYDAYATWTLGNLVSHGSAGGIDQAAEHYEYARALATELEMRPLVAHCHLGVGKVFHRAGKQQDAHEHFTTATTMYREMGMTYWLEKTDAEMRKPR